MDKRYGRGTTVKTTFELKDKDYPPNSLVKLCLSSYFFIEEIDGEKNIGRYLGPFERILLQIFKSQSTSRGLICLKKS